MRQGQNVEIKEVLQQLTAANPIAVILGGPGSGKSTAMRWFALQMAQAALPPYHRLPRELAPKQIPILIRISDYAERLSKANLTFEEFFKEYFAKSDPDLPTQLIEELENDRCLLLFDGLDEVANDNLRRQVSDNIYTFISRYAPREATAQHTNRFIVTSRIVGYEDRRFSDPRCTHYTLLELEDEQIRQFLTNWCPAAERYRLLAGQVKKLTSYQEADAKRKGDEQRERLLEALEKSPGIKRLAINPLMLTIMALIQHIGHQLPHRRIELYQTVTRTLLDAWNRESRRTPIESVPLAERLLSNLAHRLHETDIALTQEDVLEIARQTMIEAHQTDVRDATILRFIETLRRTSGLFVESGQGLFTFMHRTFQEYYVARYLLRKAPDELQQFARDHYSIALWREPLLLATAYKSSNDEQQQTSALIEAIADTDRDINRSYNAILHRGLLFATNSLVDCESWSISKKLQHDIANRLFDLYGDSFGAGRYTQLQQEIEQVMLLWLRGQQEQEMQPRLLETWHIALCNSSNPVRQEGAVHLLAALAPDLPTCPKPVLHALIPPLLQLVGLQEWYRQDLSYPEEIRSQLFQTPARPASLRIEEYALVALRLLDAAGPAGWLHSDWRKWSEERPELLERLTQHSLEIDYLLTPAAFPARSDDPNWNAQINIGNEWKKLAQRDSRSLNTQLLQASDTARFPHASLFKQLLESELASPSTPWRTVWDTLLQKEMARGGSTTYQVCLYLRLLLCRSNDQQRQEIANELMVALSTSDQRQVKALIAITNLYLLDMRYLLDLLDLRYLLDLRDLRDLRYLRYLLNKDYITGILCNMVKQPANTSTSAALLALYSVLSDYDRVLSQIAQQVQSDLQLFTRQRAPLEQQQLVEVILRRIGVSSATTHPPARRSTEGTSDEWARRLHAVGQRKGASRLTKQEVGMILAGCTDEREVSEDVWVETNPDLTWWEPTGPVRKLAWELIGKQFSMEENALMMLVEELEDDEAIVCAAAALLLKANSKGLSQDVRKEAGQKIMKILGDDVLSRRPLDTPDYDVGRLDDVLFETLRVVVE